MSSVMVTWMRPSHPVGTRDRNRSLAPPSRTIVGWPEGRFATPISRQATPIRRPVPSAFEQASLAAQRLA